ncbi:hypothetical protein R75461_07841 [Paraburkholderia nemoris]|uniref:ProQ/FINO family protein n=1 Tax=Paraburkholderia nemoris TaxID=2793076 RepID=UPI00190D523F|nr:MULTISPECIES: ProQ/FINO family protein [Paraburkholderia]MBK3786587.1 hypothetical protein [Paraburkholderia aspalathi]CAE6858277.1 hypothetical protein R75461_07841 [Paraburkholderia nemoris]
MPFVADGLAYGAPRQGVSNQALDFRCADASMSGEVMQGVVRSGLHGGQDGLHRGFVSQLGFDGFDHCRAEGASPTPVSCRLVLGTRELDVKVVSQQRRTLSLKEGLLEICKSMEQASGAQPQSAPPRQPALAHAPKTGSRPATVPRQHPAPARQAAMRAGEDGNARIKRHRQFLAIWNVFSKQYPAFRDRLPLKIGVASELSARHPEYGQALIQMVLRRHVNDPRYHERVAAGGPRYELDGSVSAGPGITAEHIARANAALVCQKERTRAKEAGMGVEPVHFMARAAKA